MYWGLSGQSHYTDGGGESMNQEMDIVVCGLSGQGIVMSSKIIATAALLEGHQVIATDIPAVKHRYSINLSHIRIGDSKSAPRILDGEARIVLAFEPLEALRVGIRYCQEGGTVVFNTKAIEVRNIRSKARHDQRFPYPKEQNVIEELRKIDVTDVWSIDGTKVAFEELGNIKALNMVMVGAALATNILPCSTESIEKAIEMIVPRGTAELNLKALQLGGQRTLEKRNSSTISN
jgi:indolepyruvate ferredoxin oxidoreductase, beta subunit